MHPDDGAEPAPPNHDARRRRLAALLGTGAAAGDPVGAPPGAAVSTRSSAGGAPTRRSRLEQLCRIAVSEVAVDGAGVTVMSSADAGRAGHRDQLAATGPLTRRLEDLQLTAGEGPCLDAHASGAPVLAPDLETETTRWLGFAPEAVAAGAAAVFSLPLQVGAVRLGTLDLHRGSTGGLSRAQLADALTLAALATEALLELAADLGDDSPERGPDGWLPDVHADVHVASGMVAAREDTDVGTALLRIRGHAFARSEPIRDVARRIIDRELVLDDPGTHDTGIPGDRPPDPKVYPEEDDR